MSFVATLLTTAAVLVWPRTRQADVPSWVAAVSGSVADVEAGADRSRSQTSSPGTAHPVGAAVSTDAGDIGTVMPVAEIAGVVDLLALTLRGGAGLLEAMEAVASRVGGPPGRHLRSVAAAGRWGVDDATAWSSVPSAWQPAVMALRMAAAAGVPPADALRGAAEEVRRAEQQRLEVAAVTLGVRIVLPLGLLFLPAFILTTVMPIVVALAHQVLVGQ